MEHGTRVLSLTPAHVARVHREIEDRGQPPGLQPQTDEDYADWVGAFWLRTRHRINRLSYLHTVP
jgi:hypothetical protein